MVLVSTLTFVILGSPLLIGEVKDDDVVSDVNEPRYIDYQQRLI